MATITPEIWGNVGGTPALFFLGGLDIDMSKYCSP
jgi:hypothetical protein